MDKLVNGRLPPDKRRPITVLSAFWRVWTSIWLKVCATKQWVDVVLDPSVMYGAGCDASVAAASVLESFASTGYMGTLDCSKCFYTLRPVPSSQLLVACGVPAQFAALCRLLWSQHRCWAIWNGHTGSQPMTGGLAIPQGDPFGPLLSALWLSVGRRWPFNHQF